MEIIECIQGSEEWFNVRRGVATASEFSKVITSEGKASTQLEGYAFKLASELITLDNEESYRSPDMVRGSELEDEACREYQEQELCLIEKVGFMKEGSYGYSPDGLVGDDGLVEIKCPNQSTHTKYLYKNRLPTEYVAQVQGGLMVSGRKWCDFISYHPNFVSTKQLFVIRINRDEEFIKLLRDGLSKLENLKNKILEEII